MTVAARIQLLWADASATGGYELQEKLKALKKAHGSKVMDSVKVEQVLSFLETRDGGQPRLASRSQRHLRPLQMGVRSP